MQNINNRFVAPTRPNGPGKDKQGISIIVLSASPGHKMRSFGNKCLLKDKHEVSLIENQTKIFNQIFSKCEIILVSGFECEKVYKNKPKCVRIVECTNYEDVNEVEEARLGLLNAMYDSVLITFGDMFFMSPFINIELSEPLVIADKEERMLADDAGLTIVDNYATIFSLSLSKPKWCKTVYLEGRELRLFKQFVFDKSNAKLYLFEALNYIIDKGGELLTKFTNASGNVIHVDSSKELERLQK
jgi:hypothetical protein